MAASGAAVVISGQGAAVTSSGQTGHGVGSGHWVVFGEIISGQLVVFSIVAFGQTGQVDSTLGGAVVKSTFMVVVVSLVCSRVTFGSSVLLLVTGAHVTLQGASRAC